MDERIDNLSTEYYKKFWKLEDNAEALPDEQLNFMREMYHTQYLRDYYELDGEEGVRIDKAIEELKLKHDKEIEELKIKRDREIGEIKLRQEKQAAKLERALYKIEKENKLAADIADAEYEMKKKQLVPDDLPKRWWQRYARPNYAKVLAQEEVDIEAAEYFGEKEQSIAELMNRPAGIEELLREQIPCPRGRRARKRWEKEIAAAASVLERRYRQQETAQEQLEQTIAAADNATIEETFAEPQGESQEGVEPEREEQPKRQRRRRKEAERDAQEPPEGETWNGQLRGQIGMEELGQAEQEKPGNE